MSLPVDEPESVTAPLVIKRRAMFNTLLIHSIVSGLIPSKAGSVMVMIARAKVRAFNQKVFD